MPIPPTVRLSVVIIAAALSACTPAAESGSRIAYSVRESAIVTGEKIKDYFTYRPKVPPPTPMLAPRFCYRTVTDIICYDQPRPGAENRLVGWQAEPGTAASSETLMVTQTYLQPSAAPVTRVEKSEAAPLFIHEAPPVKDTPPGIHATVTPDSELY